MKEALPTCRSCDGAGTVPGCPQCGRRRRDDYRAVKQSRSDRPLRREHDHTAPVQIVQTGPEDYGTAPLTVLFLLASAACILTFIQRLLTGI